MALNYQQKCRDFVLLFLTRVLRMFSYGMLSLIFFENLFYKDLTPTQSSWIQSGIVFGDVLISLVLTTQADRIGRIKTLMFGSLLKLLTGLCYAESSNIIILVISGILGVISVTGGEIGPFMPIEQSALSQLVEDCSDNKEEIPKNTSAVFGYYNMVGYVSQAAGVVFAGFFIDQSVHNFGYSEEAATQNVVRMYALIGGLMMLGYCLMNRDEIEAHHLKEKRIITCTGIKR
jgi:MFS family permease